MATATLVETALPKLSNDEISRYSRHLILPEVGMEGQQKLKAAKVLCVGTGGLGSPLALYLAAAGIGTLGLVDFDVVDSSNLQRQIIHSTKDVGRPKIDSAAAYSRVSSLKSTNPTSRPESRSFAPRPNERVSRCLPMSPSGSPNGSVTTSASSKAPSPCSGRSPTSVRSPFRSSWPRPT